jgi:hypothetical protein
VGSGRLGTGLSPLAGLHDMLGFSWGGTSRLVTLGVCQYLDDSVKDLKTFFGGAIVRRLQKSCTWY